MLKGVNDLNEKKKSDNSKKVTFNNKDQVNTFVSEPEDNNNAEPDDEDVNIFSKLKKVIQEPTINDENRIDKLERNISELNAKMDKILALLTSTK